MSDTSSELAKLGVDALKDLLVNLTQAKTFVLDQAPEFCQQLVLRALVQCLFPSAVALVILVIALVVIGRVICWVRKEMEADARCSDLEGQIFAILGTSVVIIVSFFVLAFNVYEFLSIYVAPKVFLVETITRMLK